MHSSTPPLRTCLSEYCYNVWRGKNYNGVATRKWEKVDDMFSRIDTIPACDRQTDRHLATAQSALRITSRGKNHNVTCSWQWLCMTRYAGHTWSTCSTRRRRRPWRRGNVERRATEQHWLRAVSRPAQVAFRQTRPPATRP